MPQSQSMYRGYIIGMQSRGRIWLISVLQQHQTSQSCIAIRLKRPRNLK